MSSLRINVILKLKCFYFSYLLPLKQAKTKRKTPVIRHTKDPIWDYKTEYNIDYEELLDHGIELTVSSFRLLELL